MKLDRRKMLKVGAVAAITLSAAGKASMKTMKMRATTQADRSNITALLLKDAHVREKLDAGLWFVPSDADKRIGASLATIGSPQNGAVLHHWTVAERDGSIVAFTHAVNLPPPPVYDQGGSTAGVRLDDSHFGVDTAIASELLAYTEAILQNAGAVLTVAASPAHWASRTGFLQSAGYGPTTYFLAKTGLDPAGEAGPARSATPDDIPEIVRLSALHRAQLEIANPVFWRTHTEANMRFGAWMARSLTLSDRAMFVTGSPARLTGYIIAQPGSPVNLPPPHDLSRIGLIDDFWVDGFGASGGAGGEQAVALLAAAEAHFRATGVNTALIISPVRLAEKQDFIRSRHYKEANLWLVKRNIGLS